MQVANNIKNDLNAAEHSSKRRGEAFAENVEAHAKVAPPVANARPHIAQPLAEVIAPILKAIIDIVQDAADTVTARSFLGDDARFAQDTKCRQRQNQGEQRKKDRFSGHRYLPLLRRTVAT